MYNTESYFLFLSFLGLVGVAISPLPSFAALSLVVVAASGGGLLVCLGSSFLSLILFLVYLGGMLVVFAYSIAFTMGYNVENSDVVLNVGILFAFILSVGLSMVCLELSLEKDPKFINESYNTEGLVIESVVSPSFLYEAGGGFLIVSSLALLLSLLVVLKVVRGAMKGALRAV